MHTDTAVDDFSEGDLRHLRRCVELAKEALESGDRPFGSVLVDGSGTVRFEDCNRVVTRDATHHPELAIARWAAANMSAGERAASRVYTSGEHCAMCSAAHAHAGLGPITYIVSSAQLATWRSEWGVATTSPVSPLPIQQVAPHVDVRGPVAELTDEMRALHKTHAGQ